MLLKVPSCPLRIQHVPTAMGLSRQDRRSSPPRRCPAADRAALKRRRRAVPLARKGSGHGTVLVGLGHRAPARSGAGNQSLDGACAAATRLGRRARTRAGRRRSLPPGGTGPAAAEVNALDLIGAVQLAKHARCRRLS